MDGDELDVGVAVDVGVVVDVGVGEGEGEDVVLEVGVGLAAASLEDPELEDPLEPLDPPTSNVTILAVWPEGTVTTQKLAPPAPVA